MNLKQKQSFSQKIFWLKEDVEKDAKYLIEKNQAVDYLKRFQPQELRKIKNRSIYQPNSEEKDRKIPSRIISRQNKVSLPLIDSSVYHSNQKQVPKQKKQRNISMPNKTYKIVDQSQNLFGQEFKSSVIENELKIQNSNQQDQNISQVLELIEELNISRQKPAKRVHTEQNRDISSLLDMLDSKDMTKDQLIQKIKTSQQKLKQIMSDYKLNYQQMKKVQYKDHLRDQK